MTAQADTDPVRAACGQLAAYLPRLAALLPEPDAPAGYAATAMTGGLAHAPLPGNAPALLALTGIHGIARWWEAMLLYHLGADSPWGRRGGTAGNTLAALESIVKLAGGADDDVLQMLLSDLGRAEQDAGVLPAIDEAQRWRRIRNHPCRYCGCFYLEVLLGRDNQPGVHIECHAAASVGCRDGNGRRPAATLTIDGIAWADGRTEIIRVLDAA